MANLLSVTIITKNEEKRLPKCLRSVDFADEVVVVDSGSSDRTVEIAKEFGARTITQSWLGYGRQKQFAVNQASHDWVLCLDADEWLSDELIRSIREELINPNFYAYKLARRNRFLGRWLAYGEGYPDWTLRLFLRKEGAWSVAPVHERVVTHVRVGALSGDLMHESEESVNSFMQKQAKYGLLQAPSLLNHGRAYIVMKLLVSPTSRFLKNYVVRRGFFDGYQGLIFALISSYASFEKYRQALLLSFRAGQSSPDRKKHHG